MKQIMKRGKSFHKWGMRNWLIIILLCVGLYGANILDEIPHNENFEDVEVEILISYKMTSRNNLAERESYSVSHVMN